MKHQTILISAILVLIAGLLFANLIVEKAKADEGEQSIEADWDKLNTAE